MDIQMHSTTTKNNNLTIEFNSIVRKKNYLIDVELRQCYFKALHLIVKLLTLNKMSNLSWFSMSTPAHFHSVTFFFGLSMQWLNFFFDSTLKQVEHRLVVLD